jgi:four helix bundle protein
MQDFKKLSVWHKAHLLAVAVYQTTRNYPKDELYGITSQTRRASFSVPANIAEGCGREGNIELGRFLQIALGSAVELEYHFLLACDLEFLSENDFERLNNQVGEVRKMLISFIQKLRKD